MGKALRLLFNLHPGEAQKASLFIFLGLLWSIGTYGSLVLSEGLFLEHIGAHALPQTYLIIACGMCLLSIALIISLRRFSIRYLLFSIISLWILSSLAFCSLYPYCHEKAIYWYMFKTAGWIMPISTYIVYWAFADQYFDLQDGKRFFALFNSTTFLGDAIGGGLIAYGMDFLGTQGLLILFVIALASSLPFIVLISQRVKPVLEEHVESADVTSSIGIKSVFDIVLKSKFTIYLLLFYLVMQLVAIVAEFSYMDTFDRTFSHAAPNTLTEFTGRCGMWISLGNMFFGMLVYSRLVKKMGINNIIVIAPSFFLIIFGFWIFKDALAIAVLGTVAREGMVYAFDDNNLNLLVTAVPTKIKNQVRIVVESFIEPTGMFCAASLLLLFQGHPHILGIIVATLASVLVLFLRSSYPKAIFRNLVATSIRFEMKASHYLSQFSNKELKKSEFTLLSHLKLSSEKKQLIAYEYLLKIGHERVLPHLLNHIGKLSLPGKLKAIELLSESRWAKGTLVLERLERWRRILPHPAIKSSIHFYLARHGLLRPEKIMHDLKSEHLGLKAAAILTLKTAPTSFQFPSFYALANDNLQMLLHSKNDQEVCLGLEILGLEKNSHHIETIFPFLKYPSPSVNRAAAKALAETAHSEHKKYATQIIHRLNDTRDSEIRICCLQALEKLASAEIVRQLILAVVHFKPTEYKFVERIILTIPDKLTTTLVQIVQDRKIPDKCRLLAGKILAKKDRKALQKHLYSILNLEIERAYFYFYHAHMIQKEAPEYDLTILQKALKTGYHSIIDFIIQLLGVAGSLEECEILSHTLRSQNRKIRAQAVESLEKTCDASLFSLLEPLIDERNPDETAYFFIKSGGVALNLIQLLDAMTHSSSRADQIISLAMKAQLKTPDWQTTLREKLESNEEIFHHFAHELLEGHATL